MHSARLSKTSPISCKMARSPVHRLRGADLAGSSGSLWKWRVVEIVEKSKGGLSHDLHNAWKPAQNTGFHISTATAATATIKAKAAKPLKSWGFYRFLRRTDFSNPAYQILHYGNEKWRRD